MSNPYVGEIRLFGGNFAPAGWAFCDGSLQSIAENETLFSLIGTTYGGDGEQTFALPDLRGRVPVHVGPGFAQGQAGGSEQVTLSSAHLPAHGHPLLGTSATASSCLRSEASSSPRRICTLASEPSHSPPHASHPCAARAPGAGVSAARHAGHERCACLYMPRL
jgi:microcystin-dependent protein